MALSYTAERLLSTAQATIPWMKAHPTYANQLQDLDLVELLDAANRVRDLQGHPGWTLVRGLVDVAEDRLQAQMLNSSLPSYEKLAQLQGELRGIRAMREAAETVLAYAEDRAAEERQALGLSAEEG